MASAAENDYPEDSHRTKCGSSNLFKCHLVVINLIFMVGGFVLMGLIVWTHMNREHVVYSRILEDSSSSAHSAASNVQNQQQQQQQHIPSSVIHTTTIIVVITLVVVIVVFGFLGCCGTSVESVCFLCLCVFLVVSVLITEISIASTFHSIKDKMYADLLTRMQHQIRTEYNRTTVAKTTDQQQQQQHRSTIADLQRLTSTWNNLQTTFNCCGASGPRDFRFSAWYNQTKDSEGMFVPTTCCVLIESNADRLVPRNEAFCQIEALLIDSNDRPFTELHQSGCHETIVRFVDSYLHHPLLITVFVAAILLQGIDIVFCCILAFRIRRQLSEVNVSENNESEREESEND